jgi:acetate---CoA ligase (ADP-forming)
VQSVRAYPSVLDLPDPVDLAVVTVPAATVAAVARECAQREIPALAVLSSGFAEGGAEGAARQQELVEICRGAGMRLVGPNCLGILNTTGPHLDATFAPDLPPAGNVGFVTQSGALGLALIELAGDRSLGVSSFASIGNRADITANDLLEYWEQDPATDVAVLYIESFSDPRRFSRVAQRIGRAMPVVVVKSGRSAAGERATRSHTGALLSASDVSVNALFHQAGVIRTDSLSEMLDVASLLANQPLPTGLRVGIVTNAGGPGIMCADACEVARLEVPAIPDSVQGSLRRFLAPEASLTNPVDMIATAGAEEYGAAIETLAAWSGIDALIVIFIRPLLTRAEDVARAVREAIEHMPREIPVQAVFMSARDHAAMAKAGGIPTYLYPEDAAKALARVVRHVRWKAHPRQEPLRFDDARGDEAASVIARALEDGGEWLQSEAIDQLLDCYGVAMPESRVAANAVGAAKAAEDLGGRVALKAQGPELLHKTDLAAVRLGLAGGEEVARAAEEIDESLARADVTRDSFLVQAMVDGGVELLIGVVDDPVFGPVLGCGAGGIGAELFKDVAVRVCPLAPEEAGEMLRSLALFPRLTGYRGAESVDLTTLQQMVLRVGAMVETHREIAELDLNPVVARPDGALVVDARIRVRTVPQPRPWPSTWKLGDP